LKGDVVAAQARFSEARTIQQGIVDAQPDYGPAVAVLGLIDAGLGRKEDAIREGRRAVELMPVTKDSINGAHIMSYLAMIYAWVGEKDLATEQLERVVQDQGGRLVMVSCDFSPTGIPCAAIRALRKSSPPSRRNNRAKTFRTNFAAHCCSAPARSDVRSASE
jgi:hypothetical protein